MKKPKPLPSIPIVFPRADPRELERFDIRSKICVMNCGPHTDDPRGDAERLLLCEECLPRSAYRE